MSLQRRLLTVGLGLVAIVVAYWMLALSPKRAEVAKIDDQIVRVEARRVAAVSALAIADKARAVYQRDYGNVARLGKAAPPDDDTASLVYQLETVARSQKIDFRAVSFTGGAGGAAAAPAAAEPSVTSSDGKASDTAAKPPSPDAAKPATPAAAAVAQAPPGTVVGTAGLVTLPFTLTFDGGFLSTQRLLGAIDRLASATDGTIAVRGRLLTVDGFALTASRFGFPKVKALVSATAYVVPPSEGVLAAATAQGPAGAQPGSSAAPRPTTTASVTTNGEAG